MSFGFNQSCLSVGQSIIEVCLTLEDFHSVGLYLNKNWSVNRKMLMLIVLTTETGQFLLQSICMDVEPKFSWPWVIFAFTGRQINNIYQNGIATNQTKVFWTTITWISDSQINIWKSHDYFILRLCSEYKSVTVDTGYWFIALLLFICL